MILQATVSMLKDIRLLYAFRLVKISRASTPAGMVTLSILHVSSQSPKETVQDRRLGLFSLPSLTVKFPILVLLDRDGILLLHLEACLDLLGCRSRGHGARGFTGDLGLIALALGAFAAAGAGSLGSRRRAWGGRSRAGDARLGGGLAVALLEALHDALGPVLTIHFPHRVSNVCKNIFKLRRKFIFGGKKGKELEKNTIE